MELIKRNSDYALSSLAYMARFPIGKIFTIKLISKKQDIPQAFLKKIFQKLSLHKIVSSQRGPSGGFYLLLKPRKIPLRKILESVQGRISLSDCLFENNLCGRSRRCKIRIGLSDIQKKLVSLLDRYNLEDFLT